MKNITTYVGVDAHKKDLFIAMLVALSTPAGRRSGAPQTTEGTTQPCDCDCGQGAAATVSPFPATRRTAQARTQDRGRDRARVGFLWAALQPGPIAAK